MTDLEIAKNNLSGHTICLCKDGSFFSSDLHGLLPMLQYIAKNENLCGYSVADLIVGKAAAMLFVKAKIKAVYAKTLSKAGKQILETYHIPVEYDEITDYIINRTKTDICPMEKAVAHIEDIEEGYCSIVQTLKRISIKNQN